MEKRFDVLVVGYSGYDLAIGPVPQNIMDVDSGIAPNRIITVGGDGINAATSFAHLGCKTAIATVVGRDMFAKTVLQHFAEAARELSGKELRVQLAELKNEERPLRSLEELRSHKEVKFIN